MPVVVRVKALGTGASDDAFRSGLPTATLILHDRTDGTMLVQIPDEDFHDNPATVSDDTHDTHLGRHVRVLSKEEQHDWHSHLDERYVEHKGKFRPEIV